MGPLDRRPDLGGQKWPTNIEKVKKVLDVLFLGLKAFHVAWTEVNCNFWSKKYSIFYFLQFLVFKTLDPDWIRIRFRIQIRIHSSVLPVYGISSVDSVIHWNFSMKAHTISFLAVFTPEKEIFLLLFCADIEIPGIQNYIRARLSKDVNIAFLYSQFIHENCLHLPYIIVITSFCLLHG